MMPSSTSPASSSQAPGQEIGNRFAAAMGQETSAQRPDLPFGARGLPSSSSSTANAADAAPAAPATTAPTPFIMSDAHVGRTPPTVYPEYQVLGRAKAVGVKGRLFWAGLKVFGAMEFVGEVFADFFGMYDSKYQYVVDAAERHKRELAAERAERKEQKQAHREEQQRQDELNDPAAVRAEQNRQEQAARAPTDADSLKSAVDVMPAVDHV